MSRNIKMNRKKVIQRIFIGLLILIGLVGYGIYVFFFDMASLPTGEYLTEETSPDKTYTLKAYVTNGGATTSYSVRGELVFNNQKNKTENIYWNYRQETAKIEWIDNDTVAINGNILDVPDDKFDFRNQ